ncbi:MAG: hypothetical protein JSW14_04710 [Candidatus Bathyarchaeum sp.]|nr:MAG: hypothetical protein JSW14_04710 [Candidatus Bathyarchaeum sp.]
MNESKKSAPIFGESIITAISVGFAFLLVGIIFVITPNLFDKILDFFKDFTLVDIKNSNWVLPAPASASSHLLVYQAVAQFSFALGAFQIVILALRFFATSAWEKKSETVGNLVFWLGAGFLIQAFLLETTYWFIFCSTIIMLCGVSLIARAIVMAAARI